MKPIENMGEQINKQQLPQQIMNILESELWDIKSGLNPN